MKGYLPNNMTDETELLPTEYHMAADHAFIWLRKWAEQNIKEYIVLREAIASTALSGNRMSNVLNGTLERLDTGKPVSDRYLLGLCWFVKEMYLPNREELKALPVQCESDETHSTRKQKIKTIIKQACIDSQNNKYITPIYQKATEEIEGMLGVKGGELK